MSAVDGVRFACQRILRSVNWFRRAQNSVLLLQVILAFTFVHSDVFRTLIRWIRSRPIVPI